MINMKMIEKMVVSSMAVVVKFSGIKECSTTTKIYEPAVGLIDGTVIISSYNESEENEIQFDLRNFDFNEFNSNRDKLVFNSKLNFTNSLSIQRIDSE